MTFQEIRWQYKGKIGRNAHRIYIIQYLRGRLIIHQNE